MPAAVVRAARPVSRTTTSAAASTVSSTRERVALAWALVRPQATSSSLASWWHRPPAVSRMPRVSSRLFSWLFIAVGVVVSSSTFMPSASGAGHPVVVRVLDSLAVLAGIALLVIGERVRLWVLHCAILGGVGLITAALAASGGGPTALSYAFVYLVPLYAFFVFTPRAAAAHLVVAVAVGAPVLAAQPGVGVDDQVVFWGVVVMQCVVIVWLVRSLSEAETDFTTGLVNRRGFSRSLELWALDQESARPFSLVLLGLDHFRTVNDLEGRTGGDRLLAATARAWNAHVPSGAVLSHWGADTFAVLVPGPLSCATELGDELRRALPRGTVSGGVAAWEPGDGTSDLCARAESALYAAKRAGRDRIHTHPGVSGGATALREALTRGDFVVHFQPIVDLDGGQVAGAEALVRWEHPQTGLVHPKDFLPQAESNGMIVLLGEWVLREACRQAAGWPARADGRLPYLSVNASGRELVDPHYGATVASALADSGLEPERLIIELVESDYDISSLHLLTNLRQLRALGVRTAIDDFGTGSSSLERVQQLGADLLKIDRTFVKGITDPDHDEPLVEAILAMASALRMRVVAEGVETEAQARWLQRHGATYAQGFLYGRPAPGTPASTAAPGSPHPAL